MSAADDKTQLLVWLRDKGLLKKLYEYNIISPTVFKMLEARLKVEDLMLQGMTRGDAVKRVAKMLGCHHKYVYTYLR